MTTAYLALGTAGVITVDVTHPSQPIVTEGMEAFAGNRIEAVLATNYSAITAGLSINGQSIVQVTPDVILKIHGIDPTNRILDFDTQGLFSLRVRFNKAIDLEPNNLANFSILGPDGSLLASTVLISLGALITGAMILFSCLTCNMGYYCLPLVSIALGAVGVLSARQSVDARRTRLWSWVGIAAGAFLLFFIAALFALYIGFIVLAIVVDQRG